MLSILERQQENDARTVTFHAYSACAPDIVTTYMWTYNHLSPYFAIHTANCYPYESNKFFVINLQVFIQIQKSNTPNCKFFRWEIDGHRHYTTRSSHTKFWIKAFCRSWQKIALLISYQHTDPDRLVELPQLNILEPQLCWGILLS